MIDKITTEQEALIPLYQEKWRNIALSTEPIDRKKAEEAVKAVYTFMGKESPKILFFSSPYAVSQQLDLLEKMEVSTLLQSHLKKTINFPDLDQKVSLGININLLEKRSDDREKKLKLQLAKLVSKLWDELNIQFQIQLYESNIANFWFGYVGYGSLLDFCISVLNFPHDKQAWQDFQSLVKECGYILPFEKVCLVCSRPTKLSFDNENRLHAEGEPAIQFADGYSLYAYHGLTLPEKYGQLHPEEWQASWVLEESNDQIRKLLIDTIPPMFQKKWRDIQLSTERIETQKAKEAIQLAYSAIGKPEPEIIVCDSPREALNSLIFKQQWWKLDKQQLQQLANKIVKITWQYLRREPISKLSRQQVSELVNQLVTSEIIGKVGSQLLDELRNQQINQLGNQLGQDLTDQLYDKLYYKLKKQFTLNIKFTEDRQDSGEWESQLGSQLLCEIEGELECKVREEVLAQLEEQLKLSHQISHQLDEQFWLELWSQLESQLSSLLENEVRATVESQADNIIQPQLWKGDSPWFDFGISALDTINILGIWKAFQSLVKECGWIFPFEKVCLVSSRPTKLSFDSENRLHAEGEPAIQFADGYSLYAYHGLTLPEKYGQLHPEAWQAQWVLEERNDQIRELLIDKTASMFQEKWKDISLSTERIEPHKAQEAIKLAYSIIGKPEPKIIFCDGIEQVFNTLILSQFRWQLDKQVLNQLVQKIVKITRAQLRREVVTKLSRQEVRRVVNDVIIWGIMENGGNDLVHQMATQLVRQQNDTFGRNLWEEMKQKIEYKLKEQLTLDIDYYEDLEKKEREIISLSQGEININFLADRREYLYPESSELKKQLEKLQSQLKIQPWREWQNQLSSQSELKDELEWQLRGEVLSELGCQLGDRLTHQLDEQLWIELWSQLESQIWQQVWRQVRIQIDNSIQLQEWNGKDIIWVDFFISALDSIHSPIEWEIWQSLAKECGWIFPFEKVCLVCSRPIKLSLDTANLLHAEGEPAIEFADGYSLYSYRGVTLPEKYGKLTPDKWQAQWILEENNAEVRRLLIQEIGYERIASELQATELDSWQEYTLLRINNSWEIEPIFLLKMICPSTGHIHAMQVPPTMESARKAISWVNWGIDPKNFSVQT